MISSLILSSLFALTTDSKANANSEPTALPSVRLEPAFASLDFQRPVQITHAGDGSDRLFVVEQPGRVMVFPNSPDVKKAEVFIDLTDPVNDATNEEGLLSVAFHPNYKENGRFFVYYSAGDPRRSVIAEGKASEDNPNRARPGLQVVLEQPQPAWNHNGSTLLFGPDGMLYASFGDGGAAGDPWNNAQDTTNLLGSVIRIDVDNKDAGRGYSIPADNPITIEQHQQNPKLRRELWAWGLRNVWRMSFDRTTGELWAGDVGQNKWEEVSILRKGGNYGWKVREGAHRFGRNSTKNSEAFVEPVFEYNHKKGLSITGGHVYRGPQSALQGLYMCGDYVTRRLWIMRPNGMNPVEDVREFDLGRDGAFVASFGEDEAGEMYICDHVRANPGSGVRGRILKVVGR